MESFHVHGVAALLTLHKGAVSRSNGAEPLAWHGSGGGRRAGRGLGGREGFIVFYTANGSITRQKAILLPPWMPGFQDPAIRSLGSTQPMHVFVAAAPLESSAESAPSESREEGKWVTIVKETTVYG